jgi:phosphotransferase system  glucose/maltose/N-acetylglucosamine-specific IIC component
MSVFGITLNGKFPRKKETQMKTRLVTVAVALVTAFAGQQAIAKSDTKTAATNKKHHKKHKNKKAAATTAAPTVKAAGVVS